MNATVDRRQVLILFAHPALEKSRVHRQLVAAAQQLEGVTLHDLYEAYPDFDIDVGREQRLLTEHELIVFQHPFYWYSAPALLKEWQDLVLQHGWAYGRSGTALHGKRLLSVISTGGGAQSYAGSGANRFTVRQLLAPFEQTARLCGMHYLAPFVIHGTHALSATEVHARAEAYRRLLAALRDGTINRTTEALSSASQIDADVSGLLAEHADGE